MTDKKLNMKWHRVFRDQGRECEKTGNRFAIACPVPYFPGHNVIVCIPYKTYCHSKACLKRRQLYV